MGAPAASAAWVALTLTHPEVPPGLALATALSAAVVGALAELFSHRLDDNLTIPLAAADGAGLPKESQAQQNGNHDEDQPPNVICLATETRADAVLETTEALSPGWSSR